MKSSQLSIFNHQLSIFYETLGYVVRLVAEETPLIAKGFEEPLQELVTITLEFKKGVPELAWMKRKTRSW